ncbi:MAG: hypothetical protein IKL44_00060 [Clostridia bacterium]|nr:hypothetical protein [Clostridia bacterium]
MKNCMKCKKPLTNDEVGLHKKLINRACTEFMCKECLAEHFSVSVELLDQKLAEFKKQGCLLFS